MPETPHNIFHEAVNEPYRGFLKLVERLSVGPGQPDEFHEDDAQIMEGVYTVRDDSPFLPIKGLKASFRLRDYIQWQHRLVIEVGLGETVTEIDLVHDQWLQPTPYYIGDGLTEASATVADTDYFIDDSFFAQTVRRVEALGTAGRVQLKS